MSRSEKALFFVGCAFALLFAAQAFIPARAWAAVGGANMLVLLNGRSVRLGTLTSTGTSATSTVITAGTPVEVECDAQAHLGFASSCSRDITNAAYCRMVNPRPDRFYPEIPNSGTLALISADGGTVNCSVFEKQ